MLRPCHKFQVPDVVIECVSIFVMDNHSARYRAVIGNPHSTGSGNPCVWVGNFYPGAFLVALVFAKTHRANRKQRQSLLALFEFCSGRQVDTLHILVPGCVSDNKNRSCHGALSGTVSPFLVNPVRLAQEFLPAFSTVSDFSFPYKTFFVTNWSFTSKQSCWSDLEFLAALRTDCCNHDTIVRPEPFRVNGSGRTGLTAARMGLDFVGIELNEEYVSMSRKILRDDSPLFSGE